MDSLFHIGDPESRAKLYIEHVRTQGFDSLSVRSMHLFVAYVSDNNSWACYEWC